MRRRTRLALAAAVLVVAGPVLAGCGSANGTGSKGFVAGGGTITRLSAEERKKPGEISGETLDGKQVSLSDYAGKVVVVNVWGSWCTECREEAGALTAAANELIPQGVVFLGVDIRDNSKDTALAFERRYDVPYPSIYDPDGVSLLAFHRTLPPGAVPSTVVIDANGKVAARVLGVIPSTRTLVDLVEDVRG